MENAIAIQSNPTTKGRQVETKGYGTSETTKRPSVLKWYRILRIHYHWPLFQAIRYALWLSR
jgi:hypothetical protein